MANNTGLVWKDRKRILFGLPWTFTTYKLTEEKLLVSKGLFSTTEEEVRLYRILDLTHKRKLWQKLFGLGTIHCCSARIPTTSKSSFPIWWKWSATANESRIEST